MVSFSKLKNLRVLKLEVKAFKIASESEAAVRFMDVIFPSLESLTFVGTNFEEDPMPALQKSPRLEDLILRECDCLGVKMRISARGFGRLRNLKLFMVRLDVFWIEEQAMPSLVKLELNNRGQAIKLMIPDRLRKLSQRQ